MSYQYIYVMKGLKKFVNGKQIIKETWLSFIPGAKIGIIGPNGAGKSTLLRIIAGDDKEFEGEVHIQNNIKIGYLPQEPRLDESKNVFENILEGLKEKKALVDEFNAISMKFAEELTDDEMNELLAKQAELQEKIDAQDAWDLEREIEIAMQALNCPPKEAEISRLSGGEKRRVALCKLLLERPDMLLLDEPTNHLDAESVSWLEEFLKNYKGLVITVTHDRYFLDNVAEWILELEFGQCIPWHSNYSSWLEKKQEELSKIEKEESSRKKQLKRELEWIRQTPQARQAKNKARINAYEELASQDTVRDTNIAQIIIPNGPRLGDLVIEAEGLNKSFNNRTLFSNFSFKVPPGAVVGIIGPNGVGKTTLFKLIAGIEKPDSGFIKVGPTVKLGYVDQLRDALKDNNTLWEEISEGQEEIMLGTKMIKSRAYCSAFNFRGTDQQKKVGALSGGERNRVHLAKLLKGGYNVILLDEPSNDLDVDTIRALEEAILSFAGCVMVISHDRWFLDRVATHLIVFEPSGEVMWFEGNYRDYAEYMTNTRGENIFNVKYKHKKFAN